MTSWDGAGRGVAGRGDRSTVGRAERRGRGAAGRGTAELWDEGLQSERTRLAWVRTATMLAASGLGAGGVALRTSGVHLLVAVPFALAALCGALLLARTGVRYHRVQDALHGGRPLDERADALLAWLGTLSAVTGSLAFVVLR
ncbi:hypothetical protein GCM10010156_50340 [Planobispora rosea]|uniref:DUF202 domain-containing protein n=1 Tax=Planobispora rosea TaxID=35762 RepID=A0A8J3WB01_PLARO|nr:DUF202 domain-containing protein [Planobispora rosea]GGS85696.1 hypothetical protein GCM10010156_50340 [Planobispora rosea]GIH83359.1 hypothetical protein Pro02_17670 [Planobispora rosea]